MRSRVKCFSREALTLLLPERILPRALVNKCFDLYPRDPDTFRQISNPLIRVILEELIVA